MAVLVWEAQAYDSEVWVDISSRVAQPGELTEGRDQGSLGGALPSTRPASVNLVLSDQDGYFSSPDTGAVSRPGARLRLRWGPDAANLETRFVGQMAERSIIEGGQRVATRWYGGMWKLTSGGGRGKNRLFLSATAEEILQAIGTSSGLQPGQIHVVGTSSAEYSMELPLGIQGIHGLEDAAGAWVRDRTDGGIEMEFLSGRPDRAVAHTLTDLAPEAGELPIPRPEVLTNSFGVLSAVDVELTVFAPEDTSPVTETYTLPNASIFVSANPDRPSRRACIVLDPGTIIPTDAVLTHSIMLSYPVTSQTPDESAAITAAAGTWDETLPSGIVVDARLSDISAERDGNRIRLCFDYTATLVNGGIGFAGSLGVSGTVTVATQRSAVYEQRTFTESADSQVSEDRYGARRRDPPIQQSLVIEEEFTDSYDPGEITRAWLASLANRVLLDYMDPVPVYEVEHADESAILDRRLGDKEHLRLEDGADDDYYVEALATDLDVVLTQRAIYSDAVRQPIPQPPPGPKVYWSDVTDDNIKRADLDGSNVETVIDMGLTSATDAFVSGGAGHLFWTDQAAGTVKRADLDGSNIQTIASGQNSPIGVFVSGQVVYWAENSGRRIKKSALDGSGASTVKTTSSSPHALVVSGGHIYYISGSTEIRRITTAGGTEFVMVNSTSVGGLANDLAVAGGKLYWTVSNTDEIKRCNLDGSSVETVLSSLGNPRGLAVAGGKMYWASGDDDEIKRANVDGTGLETIVDSGISSAWAVAVLEA